MIGSRCNHVEDLPKNGTDQPGEAGKPVRCPVVSYCKQSTYERIQKPREDEKNERRMSRRPH